MSISSSPTITFEQSLQIQADCNPDQTVLLRGSESHLELLIDSSAEYLEVLLEVIDKLDHSPPFSDNAEMIVRFSGKPIRGMLIDLEKVSTMYGLTIISVRSRGDERKRSFAKHVPVTKDVFPGSVGAHIAAISQPQNMSARSKEQRKSASFKVVDFDVSLL